MSDDKLLETLGKAAREQARDDPLDEQWDAFSRGELDEEAIEALAAMAADGTVPADAVEAFRPLDEDFRGQVANRAVEALATHRAGDGGASGSGSGADPIPFPAARKPKRSPMNLAPAAMAASVMLAVGIGFFAIPGSGVDPIPGYTISLQGGATSRSDSPVGEAPLFREGDRFELRLTPETAVEGDVVARIYVDVPGGLQALGTPPAAVAPSGAVRIVGTTGTDIVLPGGDSSLYIVLGREDSLPDAGDLSDALAKDDSAAGRGWSAWKIPVTTEP